MQKTKFLKTLSLISCFLFLFCLTGQARAAVECNDGIDNDGVGGIDLVDTDCSNANDDHEGNNPSDYGNFFQQHSVWYEKIPANPTLNSNSATMVQEIYDASVASGKSFYFSREDGSGWGSHPYFRAHIDAIPIDMPINNNPNPNLSSLQTVHNIDGISYPATFHSMPAQGQAIIDHGWNLDIPIPNGSVPSQNALICATAPWRDSPMNVISYDGNTIWSILSASHCVNLGSGGVASATDPSAGFWQARVVRKLSKNSDGLYLEAKGGYPWGYYDMHGQTGSGISSFRHGDLMYTDIANYGSINHALKMIGQGGKCGTSATYYTQPYPAVVGAGSPICTDERIKNVPFGTLLQLNPSFDCSIYKGLDAYNFRYKVCKALQVYGVYYIDATDPNEGTQIVLENLGWDTGDAEHPYHGWAGIAPGTFDKTILQNLRVINPLTPNLWTQPQCADGIDNDNPPDGKIDYPADPGCSSAYGDNSESGIIPSQYLPADVNQDGSVNIKDIQTVVKVIIGTLTNPRADVNGDGVKNIKDIQAIVRAIISP